jgi:competence protein ComFC
LRDFGNYFIFELLNWFFPPRCVGCGRVGSAICEACAHCIPFIWEPICEICGTPRMDKRFSQHTCIDSSSLKQIRSSTIFSGVVRKALLSLKYRNNRAVSEALVSLCAPYWPVEKWSIDGIVPVPSSRDKEKVRGYNQAKLLAVAFSRYSGIPIQPEILTKKEKVKTQVGLTHEERKQNVKNAFHSKPCQGKILLLVDDVCTTGATMESAAQALSAAGATRVYGITVSRTIRINS